MVLKRTISLLIVFSTLPLLFADGPLVLNWKDAAEIAYLQSQDVANQTTDIAIKREQYKIDIRQMLPQLTIGYSQNDTTVRFGTDSRSKQITLGLTQTIFDGGAFDVQRKIGAANLIFQQETLDRQQIAMNVAIRELFYSLLIKNSSMKVKQESIAISKKDLQIMSIEVAQGETTELDLTEAKIKVQELELALTETALGIRDLDNKFRRALNLTNGQEYQLLPDDDIAKYAGRVFTIDNTVLVSIGLAQNDELRQSVFKLEQSRFSYNQAEADGMPTIALNVQFSVGGKDFPLSVPGANVGLDVSFPSLSSPIAANGGLEWQGSATRTRTDGLRINPLKDIGIPLKVKSAKLAYQQAQNDLENARDNLRYLIPKTIETYEMKKTKLKSQLALIGLEENRLKLSEIQMRQGELRHVEVLKNRLSLSDRRTAFLEDLIALLGLEQEIMTLLGLDPTAFEAITVQEAAQ